jgi:hypothetical protein
MFSFLVYCPEVPGAHSTAMPRYPYSALDPIRLVSDEDSPDFKPGKQACARLLDREWFHSVPVAAGDVMIFSQRVPHFGTASPVSAPRMALFSMLSQYEGDNQDAFQVRTRTLPAATRALD